MEMQVRVLWIGCRRVRGKTKSKTFPLVASWFALVALVGRIKPASQAGLEVDGIPSKFWLHK
ncbi:hypothetical protein CULCOIPH002_02450 [Corynebacterium ulcerans]|uniref:Uncharacterized protein n=2 Tax=Corynebacterium ulcerans TaxID=65058 RepID=A0ABD0BG61_CORUL|nr:Hypothetical protein Cul05146_0938 [Corynebacterium ulcerans]AKN76808.1 Hypothetical protein CulFRC58_0954 [Corynebacterium ulcerans FRC58]BAM27184.1 hypothetical protein CULC0102_0985 [Corynebacterium ulcerans 0102]KPH76894.1 hypothetical protein AFK72_04595 [Corynebacterium ulcerans]OIS08809.1 hypothetical protein BHG00_10435 [Corynebacterium ulcerans]